MAQRVLKIAAIVLLFACSWLSASQAHAQVSKHAGNVVPAIVDHGSDTTGINMEEPLSIPTQKLAIVFVFICGLLYLTYFGLKRYIRWSRQSTNRLRSVGVIDTIPLGGKKFVTVTRVYDRVLVLGVAEETITLLTELSDEEMNQATAGNEKKKPNEHFMKILSTFAGKRREKAGRTVNREVSATATTTEDQAALL